MIEIPPRRISFMDPAPWMEDAACSDTNDPELFHPEDDSPRAPRAIRSSILRAKAMCSGCPVVNDCAAYALARPELSGIWGGLTNNERRRLRFAA